MQSLLLLFLSFCAVLSSSQNLILVPWCTTEPHHQPYSNFEGSRFYLVTLSTWSGLNRKCPSVGSHVWAPGRGRATVTGLASGIWPRSPSGLCFLICQGPTSASIVQMSGKWCLCPSKDGYGIRPREYMCSQSQQAWEKFKSNEMLKG